MGMYDSIHIKTGVKCPKCKVDLPEAEFQTKDLENCLNHYHFPDVLDEHKTFDETNTEASADLNGEYYNQKFYIYTQCHHKGCNHWINAAATVKGGVICKILIDSANKGEKKQKIEIPYFDGLYQIIKERNNNRQKIRDLKSALTSILFAIYNGDELTPENLKELEAHFKLDILKSQKEYFGKTPEEIFNPTSFFSHSWELSRFYEMIFKKKPESDESKS